MISVVVGRFQVPELHEGHLDLFAQARRHAPKCLVLLGTRDPDERNPLPFEARESMVRDALEERFVHVNVLPLPDRPGYDKEWVKALDQLLFISYGAHNATLFGGRDSFLSVYQKEGGAFPYRNVAQRIMPSGTSVRASQSLIHSSEFRAGVIYAWQQHVKQPCNASNVI